LKPAVKRKIVNDLQQVWSVSELRACNLLKISRTTYRYKTHRSEQTLLRMRIREIAYSRVRYGYQRIHILLRREGWRINHKRTHRLYRLEGLNLRYRKPRRHKSSSLRTIRLPAQMANQSWTMDFVCDQLFDGTRFRFLTVVDVYTRECLAIELGQRLTGEDVVKVMSTLIKERNKPKQIFLDNGSEFISKALDKWAYEHEIALAFSRPGKPTDNAYIESFNGSFRDECSNMHWFLSLEDAKIKAENWRQDYNNVRPHSALNYLTPAEFAATLQTCNT
jgi:putative transposase